MFTFADWSFLWQQNHANGQRKGQAMFNALHALDRELANMIRGTKHDPFYDDEVVPLFMQEVFGG